MVASTATVGAIRFGYGLSPHAAAPKDAGSLLAGLTAQGAPAELPDIDPIAVRLNDLLELRRLKRNRKAKMDGAAEAFKSSRKALKARSEVEFRVAVARAVGADNGFYERLVRFWVDHFAVSQRKRAIRYLTATYEYEAIRPHVTGRFADMLKAAVTHPAMLVYLDQVISFGPNSQLGRRRGKGLNENLAREVLELHTLGVGGNYAQVDVREFAELLTGLSFSIKDGFAFRRRMVEPGAETVLGKRYGGIFPRLSHITQALDDLAAHPDTARHLARKLAVHFTGDAPSDDLVAHIANAYMAHDGQLMACYSALLEHPDSWSTFGQKAKRPFDFIASALRGLGVSSANVMALNQKAMNAHLQFPLIGMGQKFSAPNGPDGWAEDEEAWITPQGMAARIDWALISPRVFAPETEPRAFLETSLADAAQQPLRWAVPRAESRWEGVALVLVSPDFNRR